MLQTVSHKSLKNSFNEFPACELQFNSASQPAKGDFFGVLSFTQPCFGETVIYVHVPVVQKVIINHIWIVFRGGVPSQQHSSFGPTSLSCALCNSVYGLQ